MADWKKMFSRQRSHEELISTLSLVARTVKHLPTMRETRVWSLGREDPLEKEMATHSSIHAWKIPWTEEPGGLWSMGSQKVGHDWATSLLLFLSKRCLTNNKKEMGTQMAKWSKYMNRKRKTWMAGKYINIYVNSSVGIEKQSKITRNFLASTRMERLLLLLLSRFSCVQLCVTP